MLMFMAMVGGTVQVIACAYFMLLTVRLVVLDLVCFPSVCSELVIMNVVERFMV